MNCEHPGCARLAREGSRFCDFHQEKGIPQQSQIDKAMEAGTEPVVPTPKPAPKEQPTPDAQKSFPQLPDVAVDMKKSIKEIIQVLKELEEENALTDDLAFTPDNIQAWSTSMFLQRRQEKGGFR